MIMNETTAKVCEEQVADLTIENAHRVTMIRKKGTDYPPVPFHFRKEHHGTGNYVRLKNITDLSCINKLRKLIELNLYSCNKLENINAIIDLKKLKTLRIEKCKYITDLSSIVPNNSIEFIYISTLSNLDFILQMKKLKKIVFHNLLDNDLLPLLESNTLEHASFISKKGYAYNEKEINSRLKNIRVTK